MNEKTSFYKKAGGLLGIVVTVLVIVSLIVLSLHSVVRQKDTESQIVFVKHGVWESLGDANESGTNSGFMTCHIRPHEAAPAVAYAVNVTNATAYEYLDTYSTGAGSPSEMTGETPFTTAFDIYVKIRLNATDGYNSSSGLWEPGWLYVNLTVDFEWAADIGVTSTTEVEIGNSTDFVWYGCYLNNGGAGYQIGKNEKIQSIKIECVVLR